MSSVRTCRSSLPVGSERCLVLRSGEALVLSGEISSAVSVRSRFQSRGADGWPLQPSCFYLGSTGQVHLCSKVVPMGWIPATGVVHHVHRGLLTSPLHHLRCLEPSAEVRQDRPLPPETSSTTTSFELCCPTQGNVSKAADGQNESYVESREGRRRFRLVTQHLGKTLSSIRSWFGGTTRGIVYEVAPLTREDSLFQLPPLDGKRLLCHCERRISYQFNSTVG